MSRISKKPLQKAISFHELKVCQIFATEPYCDREDKHYFIRTYTYQKVFNTTNINLEFNAISLNDAETRWFKDEDEVYRVNLKMEDQGP